MYLTEYADGLPLALTTTHKNGTSQKAAGQRRGGQSLGLGCGLVPQPRPERVHRLAVALGQDRARVVAAAPHQKGGSSL